MTMTRLRGGVLYTTQYEQLSYSFHPLFDGEPFLCRLMAHSSKGCKICDQLVVYPTAQGARHVRGKVLSRAHRLPRHTEGHVLLDLSDAPRVGHCRGTTGWAVFRTGWIWCMICYAPASL